MRTRDEALRRHWDALAALDPDQSVIDPNDRRGHKNRYLGQIRDHAFVEALGALPGGATILDLGCGSGSGSIGLLASGWSVLGLDISLPLLRQAVARCGDFPATFAQVDGRTLPVLDGSVDAAVTYGVLIYVVDDDALVALLRQLRGALAPGGTLVLIEQARRRGCLAEAGLKRFRSPEEWCTAVTRAGFALARCDVLRHGRFPATPLVRQGLVPRQAWGALRRVERWLGRIAGVLPWDYADIRIVATSPRG